MLHIRQVREVFAEYLVEGLIANNPGRIDTVEAGVIFYGRNDQLAKGDIDVSFRLTQPLRNVFELFEPHVSPVISGNCAPAADSFEAGDFVLMEITSSDGNSAVRGNHVGKKFSAYQGFVTGEYNAKNRSSGYLQRRQTYHYIYIFDGDSLAGLDAVGKELQRISQQSAHAFKTVTCLWVDCGRTNAWASTIKVEQALALAQAEAAARAEAVALAKAEAAARAEADAAKTKVETEMDTLRKELEAMKQLVAQAGLRQ